MAIPIAILDCDLLLHGRGHKTLDRFDLDSVSDTILLTQFGFPREFILYLVELLRDVSIRTLRSRAISPEVQVLAALGFYTSGSFQTSMGDTIGISQASMSRCVSNVTKALVEKAPHRELTFQEFQRVAGFPGVLGVLDCVQVAIKAPNSEDSSYVNKKGFHSVACQLVCDARGLLLSAETHWPGGLKDTDVLERSALHKQLQDFEKGWLLGGNKLKVLCFPGDCRYPLRKWLMTPVYSPESPAERHQRIPAGIFLEKKPTWTSIMSSVGYFWLSSLLSRSGLDAWTLERTDPPEQPESLEQRPEDRDSLAEDLRRQLILKHFS
uniref:Putative nuclease HARBI1 n=1 Tax=Scophthalmus maximus TaxID=52904 RepID=A0A8D3DU17_SCOMX